MAEIRETIQEFISWLLSTVLGDPIGYTLTLLWLGVMFIVGVVTSMRWTSRSLRKLFRPSQRSAHGWGSDPEPPADVASAAGNAPSAPAPFPLRLEDGPRDW